MPPPEIIKELVGKFDSNRGLYCGPGYNETRLRREFLDPFFEALGWDVDNTRGVSPVYQEVVHEYGTAVEGAQKTADYAFRIGERVKFFVEAKKPGVRLKEDAGPAYQLRKYAYSKQLPLSILTDFEEFAVYDGRVKPAEKDTAAKARVMYLTYEDYVERWDDIESVFGRDAIWKGAFDKFADENKGGKHEPLDKTFLAMLEGWRDLLARNVANRNRDLGLDRYALTWAVQAVLDRIIFLRVAEARGIEPDGNLRNAAEGSGVYERLVAIFREADDRYNSGLFHFREEKDRPGTRDELTPDLSLDDAVLKKVINELYDSPYEFGVVPVEILGHAYEQFLGKTIYVDGRGVHIDDKPEVRKAGGVYYTPEYIVEYIVENTVGELLKKCKAPKDAAKLRILDPACGSGSFLLGAYQRLLDWHMEWYFNDGPEKHADKLIPVSGGMPLAGGGKPLVGGGEERRSWRLSIAEKKRILLNNIYGVDIDASAVEVTKLSLLLKALEGESAESVGAQEKLYKDRALPDLANNVKCGNSLIGWDYFDGQLSPDPEEVRRVNPFDWEVEFPDTMSAGGFDAVIGNPPWGAYLEKTEKGFLVNEYLSAEREVETNLVFVEKSLSLISANGYLGMILPNTCLYLDSAVNWRSVVLRYHIIEVIEFSKRVFVDAPDIVPLTVIISGRYKKRSDEVRTVSFSNRSTFHESYLKTGYPIKTLKQKTWEETRNRIFLLNLDERALTLFEKIRKISVDLEEAANVFYGIKTGDNRSYLSNSYKDGWVKALKTGELTRYHIDWKGWYLNYGKHLTGYTEREIDKEKIVIQYIRKLSLERRLICALDNKGIYYPLNNYSVIIDANIYSLKYLLGILDSTLLNFYFANNYVDYNIKPIYLRKLPIRTIDFTDTAEVAKHDAMVAMVDRMLDLHKRLAAAKTPNKREAVQREIDATDARIDALVYELYGLTDEEIKIVEGS